MSDMADQCNMRKSSRNAKTLWIQKWYEVCGILVQLRKICNNNVHNVHDGEKAGAGIDLVET